MNTIQNIAEWKVIGLVDTSNGGVALGYSKTSPTPYATWIHTGNHDYITGRYFMEKERALLDFYERACTWI